jgi:hypothetical protein
MWAIENHIPRKFPVANATSYRSYAQIRNIASRISPRLVELLRPVCGFISDYLIVSRQLNTKTRGGSKAFEGGISPLPHFFISPLEEGPGRGETQPRRLAWIGSAFAR